MTDPEKIKPSHKLLFYTITILFFLLLLNGVLSLLDREQIMVRGDEPGMVYAFYPDRQGVSVTPEYRTAVHTDSMGLRSCPVLERRREGNKRLLFLGDSFTEGWGVSCEGTFAALVAKQKGDTYSVYNGGIHGGAASYFVLRNRYYQERIHPDVLVVQIFDNDLDDLDKFAPFITTGIDGRIKGAKPAGLLGLPAGPVTRFVRETMLYRTTRRIIGWIRKRPVPIKFYRTDRYPKSPLLTHEEAMRKFHRPAPLSDPEKDYGGQFAFYKYRALADAQSDPLWGSRFRRMDLYLRQMVEEARAKNPNIRILFLYIPAMEVFVPGGILGRIRDASGNPRRATVEDLRANNPFVQLLDQISREEKVELLDGDDFLWKDAGDLYYPGDAHLTPEGHVRLAQILLKRL